MKSYVYAMCVGLFASSFVACVPGESVTGTGGSGSSSGGSGGEVPTIGKSRVLESFQLSRRAMQTDPEILDAIDKQLSAEDMIDNSSAAEQARIDYILNWTVDVYEQAWAQAAGVSFERGSTPRTKERADAVSAAFDFAATATLAKLPEQPWDAEWENHVDVFMTMQSYVSHPAELDEMNASRLGGVFKCMKIVAILSDAKTVQGAVASLGGINVQMLKSEDAAFDDLAAMTGK
jgi:hypothetical protein